VISKKDLLLGKMVVEKGLLTQKQVEECIREQNALSDDPDATFSPTNTPRPLGMVLLSKGYLKQSDLVELLEEQNRRHQTYKHVQRVDYLFGQLLVKHNHATQLQINKCMEIQIKMAEKGAQTIPRLGEILIEHGFVDKKTITEVLRLQDKDKDILCCTGCSRQFNVVGVEDGKAYTCKECGGVLLRRDILESLKTNDTLFGFDLPAEER
jgi:hypothetical protein